MVNEHRQMGEKHVAGVSRTREEVFQKYDRKLKEEEEVSHVATVTLCMM